VGPACNLATYCCLLSSRMSPRREREMRK
jgi:hypothetical protein